MTDIILAGLLILMMVSPFIGIYVNQRFSK